MILQEMIKQSVHNNANKALIDDGKKIVSYQAMYEKACVVGEFLWKHYRTKNIIPIMFSSTEYYIYAMVGSLFSNNIFMPLDSSHPIERITNCMKLAKCSSILVDKTLDLRIISMIQEIGIEVIFIENILNENYIQIDFDSNLEHSEEDAIYVYFTSGSTGTPKGILGKNKSLCHFIDWEINEFNISSNDRFAQVTSPVFDPYLRDVFTPLCSGACIYTVDKKIVLFSGLFSKFLHESKISFLHTTPTIFENLLNITHTDGYYDELKYILLAGEKLPPQYVIEWYQNNKKTQLVNLYGPTETTLAKVFSRLPSDFNSDIVPVGKAFPGTCIKILRDDGSECVIGESGEVYIETEFMTYGYLYDDANASFKKSNGKNVYATGDLGYIENGNLFLTGRKDDQKKIGGVRIDLNEIENRIIEFNSKDISRCVVVYNNDMLLAFYMSTDQLNETDIRMYLKDFLLSIHIPRKFIRVDNFPITVNGKVYKESLFQKYLNKV